MITATSFELKSLDHDNALLNSEIHNTRHLLTDDSKPPKQLELSFTIDGVKQKNVLHRSKGAFSEGATVSYPVEGKPGEFVKKSAPELFTYYSADKDWVLTFHTDSKFDGLIFNEADNSIHHFFAENGKFSVNGAVKDWFPGEIKSRHLTSEANGIDYWDDCHPGQPSGLTGLSIGLVVGNVHYQSFGEETSMNQLNSYISLSNTIYERQLDVSLTIGDVFMATQPNMESFLPGTCSRNIQSQLSGLARWRKPSNQVLWHLVDDCFGAVDNTLGIAYLGTLCSNNNVGVNYYSEDDYPDPGTYPTWATVAHELGHNFDAQHSFEEGQGRTGGIMDYGNLRNRLINGEVQFNTQYREREVCREVTNAFNRGCLDEGIAPSPTAQFTSPVAERVEVFASNERELNCVKHAHKVPLSSAHLKRFSNLSRIECRKECASREYCRGFVFARDGWCELLNTVNVDDLTYATNFNTVICGEGDLPERVKARSEDDILDTLVASQLQDKCCVETVGDTYSGMNLQYIQETGLTLEQCEEECIKNSKCEAVTYDDTTNSLEPGCMLFGGNEFSHLKTEFVGATTLSCNRGCISNVVETTSEGKSIDISSIFGGIALVAGVVGLVAGAIMYKRRSNNPANDAPGSAEGTVHQATL